MDNNYGHPLRFGLSLRSSAPAGLAERGALAEALGYDLVSVPDSGELDAWSVASWLAAGTERIILSPLVSLGENNPAVLGRAAASLDLLSGGRLELGLTLDSDSDPDSDTDSAALGEAIDVIRGIWAGEARAALRYDGEHYQLHGAAGGPRPAHRVPIVVQGDGTPALAGATADGWLARGAALRDGTAIVDAAARAAGRDPREIRRVLEIEQSDVPSTAWAAELLPLVTGQGVGDILLQGADPAVIRRFITEVAPALRQAADLALPGLSTATPVRPAAALALRVAGIDYDSIPLTLAAIEPGDHDYATVHSTYLRGGSPGLVLRPHTAEQVTDAVAFARRHRELPLGIRSGGHGISGRSTNRDGIVIDVSALDEIEVLDTERRLVRIGPGARWGEVAAALEPYGWAISSGDYGGVGVGGLATAGGIGFLGRAHGLTIDHLRAVELVLADGSRVRASASENPDLFWAVRGAGPNFGIATAFEFEAAAVPGVGWAELVFDASDTAGFLEKWGATLEATPRDTTSFITLGGARPGEPLLARFSAMVDSDDPDTIISRLQPFADIAPMYQQSVQLLSYARALMPAQGEANGGSGEPHSRSGLLEHMTPEFARAAAGLLGSGASYFFQIRATGGAASDVDPDATAYAHRSAQFSVAAMGASAERLDRGWAALEPAFAGLYLSFDTGTGPDRIAAAFPPRTLERLRALKAQYDPTNLFHDNFAITPATASGNTETRAAR
ncbi:LLM class flavin-dependent oxidoreductase [Microterricola viridarii]|uniref:FAD/FMN-containing dehydrogenase n=1 Tax=Microterricola viridarii TaxID=412690 RepID=A0A1H1WBR7_9MICO|nr:LLM class flavin-dependent oxidoreductase [Microterricola viridarii]SDS94553.1 FAD/FMN-containing dehydrogenase [Microterricola viridarii]